MAIKKTIALSLTLVVLIIFTAGQGSVWVWFLFSQKSHNERLLADKMETSAKLAAQAASKALLAGGDAGVIEGHLEGMSAVEGVLSAKVLDAKGVVIAEKKFVGETKGAAWNPLYIPWVNRRTVPMATGDGVGSFELVYSGRSVNNEMFYLMTIPTIIEGVVLLLIIAGIFFYLHGSVGRPLSIVRERISRATQGDLTVEIPDFGTNEIGTIGGGLRFLIGTLHENIARINATAEKLSVPVATLRAKFEDVSRGIRRQFSSAEEIASSLKQASESHRDITENTEKLSEFSADNVSFLLEVKSTSDEIVLNTNRLFKSVEDSYSVVAEMSQTSKVVTQNSQEVLSAVDETLASVEEIRASVKEVERSAKESSSLAARVREMAVEEGTLVVADAVEGMENISGTVQRAVDMVEQLGTRSLDVQKMLSVIREVTEQTNLLSLNAAILAEQAGEFGRGFAVVADEMRALSDRTAASTKEIAGVVKTIQDEIHAVITSIKASKELVSAGEGLVYKVGESMGRILEAAQKSANMAQTIENATGEQAGSLDLVTSSMSSISAMASKMVTAMAEQQSGLEHMLEKVSEIREVAEITKRSTEEQAKGTGMMSKNVELASSKISSINEAAIEQQSVNEAIIVAAEDIRKLGSASLEHVEEMSGPLARLVDEMDLLKKEMSVFKVK